MKILDIRGNLVKIESSKPVSVSSLLKIVDNDNSYVAQVLYAEAGGASYMIFAKLLANFASPKIPVNIQDISKDAHCEKIDTLSLISNLGSNADVVLGELAYDSGMLTSDRLILDNRILIASEKNANTNLIINNLSLQIINLGYNTLIFDTDGTSDGVRLNAGIDFKLPLNSHAIEFVYNKYFSDITDESRSLINSIFTELKEYAATVPYIPFKAFKSVIDEVLDYSQNLSLYFFKTKLEKLAEINIFANTHDEIMDWTSLSEFGPGTIVIDLSHINKIFVSEYISLVLEAFKGTESKLYAFAKLSDVFINKDLVKEIIESSNVITSCVVHSNCKFLSALKQNSGSFIVTGGIRKPENFDYCKFLLKNLPNDKYILTGNISAPYSFIFQLKEITEVIPKKQDDNTGVNGTVAEQSPVDTSLENVVKPVSEQDGYEPLPVIEEEPHAEIADYQPETINTNSLEQEKTDFEEAGGLPVAEVEQPDEKEVSELLSISAEENENEPVSAQTAEVIPESDYDQPVDDKLPDTNLPAVPVAVPETEKEVHDERSDVGLQKQASDLNSDGNTLSLNSEHNPEQSQPESVPADTTIEEPDIQDSNDQLSLDEVSGTDENIEEYKVDDNELDLTTQYEPVVDNEAGIDTGLDIVDEIPELEDDLDAVLVIEEDTGKEQKVVQELPAADELELKFEDDSLNLALDNNNTEIVPEDLPEEQEKTPEELLDEEIRRDVDKVYMAQHQEESDELSEDDLDFIEELVGTDDVVLEEAEPETDLNSFTDNHLMEHSDLLPEEDQQPVVSPDDDGAILPQRNTAAPAVPIYTAEIPEDALVHSDPIQQGDRVVHVKFGVGVVEKIFSYGTKNFCSINFENIGRKVLDPNITELKKA